MLNLALSLSQEQSSGLYICTWLGWAGWEKRALHKAPAHKDQRNRYFLCGPWSLYALDDCFISKWGQVNYWPEGWIRWDPGSGCSLTGFGSLWRRTEMLPSPSWCLEESRQLILHTLFMTGDECVCVCVLRYADHVETLHLNLNI